MKTQQKNTGAKKALNNTTEAGATALNSEATVIYSKIVSDICEKIGSYATGVKGETTHNKRSAEREFKQLQFVFEKIQTNNDNEEFKTLFFKIKLKIEFLLSKDGEEERRKSWKNMPCYKARKKKSDEKKLANLMKKYL